MTVHKPWPVGFSPAAAKFVESIRLYHIPGYGDDEVGFMAETAWRTDPDVIFDWGTNLGASARIFHELHYCEVVTVDLPPALEPLDRDHAGVSTGRILHPSIRQLHGDGVTMALQTFREGPYVKPLFFLDGCHLAENVFREIWSINRVCPQGSLLIHDTRQQPGKSIRSWQRRYGGYKVTWLQSQAGMASMVPK